MSEITANTVRRTASVHGALRAILLGGLVAGTLDIGAACAINGRSPVIILHAIAGGVLGQQSFHMGASSAVLGLLLQWFMSWLIAAIYVGATFVQPALFRRWVWSGCAYGLPIYFVMNYIVVPMSAVSHRPTFTATKAAENMLAMIFFGLIVAYFARDWPTRPAGSVGVAALGDSRAERP